MPQESAQLKKIEDHKKTGNCRRIFVFLEKYTEIFFKKFDENFLAL